MRKAIIEILKKADAFDLIMGLVVIIATTGIMITLIILAINQQ